MYKKNNFVALTLDLPQKTKWYDNLLTEDFKKLNIKKKLL